jgi:NTP pyrophosphatase (non-canonical NTP hydrolase)
MDSTDIEIRSASYCLQRTCHGLARDCGWWTDGAGNNQAHTYKPEFAYPHGRNIGEMLCLIHSEISEAMEGARKGLYDDKLPHRPMLEVELADAVIRIFDMAGGLNLDLGGAIAEKLQYNASRADHKPENRRQPGGKAF